MKITKTQEKILNKMKIGETYTAYDLQESLSSLRALTKLGLLKQKNEVGYVFFPRTAIIFSKIIK